MCYPTGHPTSAYKFLERKERWNSPCLLFNAPVDKPTSIHPHTGKETREISFEPCNQYTIQGELFSKAILENKEVPTELNDALADMKVIDAVIRSNRQRAWVML